MLHIHCSDEKPCQLCKAPSKPQGGPHHRQDDGQIRRWEVEQEEYVGTVIPAFRAMSVTPLVLVLAWVNPLLIFSLAEKDGQNVS